MPSAKITRLINRRIKELDVDPRNQDIVRGWLNHGMVTVMIETGPAVRMASAFSPDTPFRLALDTLGINWNNEEDR